MTYTNTHNISTYKYFNYDVKCQRPQYSIKYFR